MNKHRIIGFVVLLALAAMGIQFLLDYQKTTHRNAPLQAFNAPPITPLKADMTSADHAPKIQSTAALMEKHFSDSPDAVTAVPAWIVQVASLSTEASAQALVAQLQKLGFDAFIVSPPTPEGLASFRISAGPFTQQQNALDALNLIAKNLKVTGILKQYTPIDAAIGS